jgi:hypothetical protein
MQVLKLFCQLFFVDPNRRSKIVLCQFFLRLYISIVYIKIWWNPSKLQTQSNEIEDLYLMLNWTSPCTNPLSQLHLILFTVVPRFISAIPIGRLLHYTKIQWAQSPWPLDRLWTKFTCSKVTVAYYSFWISVLITVNIGKVAYTNEQIKLVI